MSAEQELSRLQESKARMEMLIRYFRGKGTKEAEFAGELEERLRGVRDAMRLPTTHAAC